MSRTEQARVPEQIEPLRKVLIANRGEIAVRAARAFEKRAIAAVVPYAFGDEQTLIVRIAERNKDPGWELAPIGGTMQEESYANPQKMLDTAILHECDAVFLGYGFLAEDPLFVQAGEKAGIRMLAPPSKVMELSGNKILAREEAKKVRIGAFAHIPIIEGGGNLPTFDAALRTARDIGFPVMLKDPDLGGGMGNRVARNEEELERAFVELRSAPDNKEVFLERYIEHAVHVEVQIAADSHHNVVSLEERDCTLQRKHQKIIEESPSPHINDATRQIIQTAAVNFARHIGYSGIGTWEFLVDLDRRGHGRHGEQDWYFMEINPRIQVEHPVTEEQTGIDIVDLMIDIEEGRPLPFTQESVQSLGHTIEARVYAENPERNFTDDSGTLELFAYAQLPNVRVETGYEQDDTVSPWYDKTICKVIAHGNTREEARHNLVQSLLSLQITGVSHNKDFLLELLDTPEFREGKAHTTFIEEWWRNRQRERIHGLEDFIGNGTFIPYSSSHSLDTALLPQNITVASRSQERPVISYDEYLEEQRQRSGKESALEYGTMERDGIQFVLARLDYDFLTGTLGIAEGWSFQDACRLAYERGLPLMTISSSAGARQHENTLALAMMNATVDALSRYPPAFHVNIYTGNVYGGVPASYAGVADLQIAIEGNIGFTGPYPLAKTMLKEPASFRAEDAYAVLPEGTHSPLRHLEKRNIHMLFPSLRRASDSITHLLHMVRIPETITDTRLLYQPRESIGLQRALDGTHLNQLGRNVQRIVKNWRFWQKRELPEQIIFAAEYPPLPPIERLSIIEHPNRPTAADLIDTNAYIFEDALLLSSHITRENTDQLPPIIAAIAQIDGLPVFILGHQTQRRRDEMGKTIKYYDSQKPEDWEYTEQMVQFAKKLGLPIILFGDTQGADCLPESEDRNQSHKIARILRLFNEYPFPTISVNIGMKGSGGGETFIRPMDAAADFENAMSFVSAPMVQYWILTGKWIDHTSSAPQQEELRRFIEQLHDATAEGRLATYQIDKIIKEGRGGAHIDPRIPSQELRTWFVEQLRSLRKITQRELLMRRRERIDRVMQVGVVENSQF